MWKYLPISIQTGQFYGHIEFASKLNQKHDNFTVIQSIIFSLVINFHVWSCFINEIDGQEITYLLSSQL